MTPKGLRRSWSIELIRSIWFEATDQQFRSRHSRQRAAYRGRRFIQALLPVRDNQHRRPCPAQSHTENAVGAGQWKQPRKLWADNRAIRLVNAVGHRRPQEI